MPPYQTCSGHDFKTPEMLRCQRCFNSDCLIVTDTTSYHCDSSIKNATPFINLALFSVHSVLQQTTTRRQKVVGKADCEERAPEGAITGPD